jgi:hypothetical protein
VGADISRPGTLTSAAAAFGGKGILLHVSEVSGELTRCRILRHFPSVRYRAGRYEVPCTTDSYPCDTRLGFPLFFVAKTYFAFTVTQNNLTLSLMTTLYFLDGWFESLPQYRLS